MPTQQIIREKLVPVLALQEAIKSYQEEHSEQWLHQTMVQRHKELENFDIGLYLN
jgi:hypothetical protein